MNDAGANLLRDKYADIINSVCLKHGITKDEILSPRRHRPLVIARAELCKALSDMGLSSPVIGAILNRDHTGILHLLGRTKEGKICAQKHRRPFK